MTQIENFQIVSQSCGNEEEKEIISLIEKFQLPIQSCENDEEKQIAEQKIRTQRILGQLIKEGQEKGEIAKPTENQANLVTDGNRVKKTLSDIINELERQAKERQKLSEGRGKKGRIKISPQKEKGKTSEKLAEIFPTSSAYIKQITT